MTCGRLAATACAALALAAAPARADTMLVRVLSDAAEVRTGPGFTFRAVYTAARGETLRALGRARDDYWFRVQLPDGTYGWILGDQVLPLEVDTSAPPPPGFWSRLAGAIFSPPPLATGDVGLSFCAGLLGGEGMVLFRPAVLLAPHLALEGFFGETVGEHVDVLHYGAAANLYLLPTVPLSPFFTLGGGGARGRPKADQFADRQAAGHYYAANVGGGLLIALKKRITLRADFRNYVIFDPAYTRNVQEYSGGLSVVF